MNTLKNILILVAILSAALILASCSSKEQAVQIERTVAVKTMVVSSSNQDMILTYTGSLEGEKQAVLYAKLAEAVEQVHVREGQGVAVDETLVSLDKNGPSARYTEAQSLYLNAEKNFKRMEYLYKEGAVAESQYDAAKTQYEVAKAGFDGVLRLVDIRTPIAGVVTSVKVSPGDFVQLGQQLATVSTTKMLRIKFGVNTNDISYVTKGSHVTISAEMSSDTAGGTIVSLASAADPATRTFQVEALINNDGGNFMPGMFVKVHILREKLNNIIAVPRDAILTLDDKPTVFVVTNGTVHSRVVSLGADLDGVVVVSTGLNPGDTVVTLGQNYLDDGFKVKITSVNEGIK